MKKSFLLLVAVLLLAPVAAQDTAVLSATDTLQSTLATDTFSATSPAVQPPSIEVCIRTLLRQQKVLQFSGTRDVLPVKPKIQRGKEWLFYYLLAIMMLLGMIRLVYSKYFRDLFRVFFRTSLRVNQIREQLVQSGMASLLLNIFFFVSGGTYIFLLFQHYPQKHTWEQPVLLAGSVLAVALLYSLKFIFLQLSGWLFSIQKATEAYIFIVFMINKVLGIALLPFIIVIAFAEKQLAGIMVTASLAMVVGLFLYRFLRAYQPVSNEISVSRFHFLLYLLAFEVVPLFVIYKVFILYF